MFIIAGLFKSVVIHLRAWTKFIMLLLMALGFICFLLFVVYKPMYLVKLDGKEIGYTENKKDLQKRINSYRKNGDNKTVAFVEIDKDKMPEYSICFLKKGLTANDNEIFDTVIASGIPYYKYYTIMENNEEKYYVATYEECESIIQTLKDKDSNNKENVTYALRYETELKEFTTTELAVNGLYVEKPKASKNKKVNTMKTMDYSNTALGINLIRPVSGTITSRFGRRSRGTHTGLDIANSKGVPIKAAASGTVIYSGRKGSYGYMIVIDHGKGVQTYYAHCSRLDVSAGTYVNQGDVIAAVGSTGNSTGPHLHFEVRVNGAAKNPQNYVY